MLQKQTNAKSADQLWIYYTVQENQKYQKRRFIWRLIG